jgi:NAD(P)-dependent dehydrogenase (short-subunit alcohol dehydrogenase family)
MSGSPSGRPGPAPRFYLPSWRRAAPAGRGGPSANGGDAEGAWVVVADRGGLGERVSERLARGGARVERVTPEALDPGRFAALPLAGVLHLGSLGGLGGAGRGPGLHSLLQAARALARRGEPVRLIAVTAGAQDVLGGDGVDLDAATLPALCRAIAREHPRILARSIDLPPPSPHSMAVSPDDLAAWLAGEAGAALDEPVVALRGAHRWLAAFEPMDPPASPPRFPPDGHWLITGGLGRRGLAVARQLARLGRARLTLLDTRPAGEGSAARLRALEALGCEVAVVQGDVTREAGLAERIGQAVARFGELAGVVHAAAATGPERPLAETDPAECEAWLAPRGLGLLNLDAALAEAAGNRPGVCLSLSSLAPVIGGSAARAVADAFADAFALRRGRLPWTVVNWEGSEEDLGAVLEPLLACEGVPQVVVSAGPLEAGALDWSRSLLDLPRSADPPEEPIAWHPAGTLYPRRLCIHELFDAWAERQPGAVAVESAEETLTYRELARQADRLARQLRGLGVGPDAVVALAADRSAATVAAMLAVLVAGGACLPVEASGPVSEPAERLRLLLPGGCGLTVGEAGLDHLAYVLDGVLLPHRGLPALAVAQALELEVGPEDRVLALAPPDSAGFVWEVWMALGTGARLCLARPGELRTGPDLARTLAAREITHLTIPPSALARLPEAELPALRVLCVAGDPCPPGLAERWARGGRRLFAVQGPVEATLAAILTEIAEVTGPEPAGRPFPPVRVHVLDADLAAVPAGVPGELCLGGQGLARGYREDPAATAARFVPDPFAGLAEGAGPGGRLFRTGTRALVRPDGSLERLG